MQSPQHKHAMHVGLCKLGKTQDYHTSMPRISGLPCFAEQSCSERRPQRLCRREPLQDSADSTDHLEAVPEQLIRGAHSIRISGVPVRHASRTRRAIPTALQQKPF